jgi:predicted nucleotidyltransferase
MDAVLARYRSQARALEEVCARARAALPVLVRVLVEEFGARRVVLFGSIAHGLPSAEPDIDLLVEGVAPDRLGEAHGRLFALAPLPVDLVALETGPARVVAGALESGEVLHAA